jgi:hypothetical protein
MELKRLVIVAAAVSALLAGCAPTVTRMGYSAGAVAADSCRVALKKAWDFDSTKIKSLGSIEVGEASFARNCSEREILGLLRREACGLGANVVNITEEKRPDAASTCYRARADFLKITDSALLATVGSDSVYSGWKVEARVAMASERNSQTLVAALITGFVVGLLVAFLF